VNIAAKLLTLGGRNRKLAEKGEMSHAQGIFSNEQENKQSVLAIQTRRRKKQCCVGVVRKKKDTKQENVELAIHTCMILG
jgi:hypothetical protein